MPAPVIHSSDYVYIGDVQQVYALYQQGAIKPDGVLDSLLNSSTTTPLPAPITGFPAGSLLWALADRAVDITAFSGDKSVFLNVFLFSGEGGPPNITGPAVAVAKLKIGRSGSGNKEIFQLFPEGLNTRFDQSLRLFSLDTINQIILNELGRLAAPARIQQLEAIREMVNMQPVFSYSQLGQLSFERPVSQSFTELQGPQFHVAQPLNLANASPAVAVQGINVEVAHGAAAAVSMPSLIHITQPASQDLKALANELFPPPADNTKTQAVFNYLSSLPFDHIDEHGKQSAAAVKTVVPLATLRYVSAFYPFLTPTPTLSPNAFRYGMAFTSPTILALRAGDVVFISESFQHATTAIKLPIVYDLAVYQLTAWLESRGVMVLFSAGGGSVASTDIGPDAPLMSQYVSTTNPLPGLLIGGFDPATNQFTSNFGSVVQCYAPPVVLPTGPPFDGSSGATAYVSGLMLAAQQQAKTKHKPFLTPAQLKTCLQGSTTAVTIEGQAVRKAPTLLLFLRRVNTMLTTGH